MPQAPAKHRLQNSNPPGYKNTKLKAHVTKYKKNPAHKNTKKPAYKNTKKKKKNQIPKYQNSLVPK